ncbi:MAG: hypothetical protein ACPGMR_08725 [Pontibacterium sp.]
MKISQSDMALSAKHQSAQATRQEAVLERYTQAGENLQVERKEVSATSVSLSKEATALAAEFKPATTTQGDTLSLENGDLALSDKMKMAKYILQAMTGQSLSLKVTNTEAKSEQAEGSEVANEGALVGMRYEETSIYTETEELRFSGRGVVTTESGQSIAIDMAFVMNRSFSQAESFSFAAGVQLEDPLVINFDTHAVSLTNETHSFDLNSDGQTETLNQLGAGSGFLMLDKNGDGKATNGSELFGATTGNGFKELAKYDDDGNGFIDENDAVYSQLQIWVKTGGEDQTYSLKDKDVGAIYLGAIATPFELKNQDNELLGVVRGSSIYLGNQGSVGSVQQIDLVV